MVAATPAAKMFADKMNKVKYRLKYTGLIKVSGRSKLLFPQVYPPFMMQCLVKEFLGCQGLPSLQVTGVDRLYNRSVNIGAIARAMHK